MAELDNIPQTQSIEIATAKLDEATVDKIKELRQNYKKLENDFGSI